MNLYDFSGIVPDCLRDVAFSVGTLMDHWSEFDDEMLTMFWRFIHSQPQQHLYEIMGYDSTQHRRGFNAMRQRVEHEMRRRELAIPNVKRRVLA